ncbi:MAG: hypothetical protein EOR81_24975 [Mesorhizobium sp.]|nr:MAG: hypothetical protein EOR81_24975 [Mesorhizobium sp.]
MAHRSLLRQWRFAKAVVTPISPLVGEMSGRTEGGALPPPSKVLHRRDALISSWHECHAIFAELDTHNP